MNLWLVDSGLLSLFFFGSKYANVQAIDFYSLPKAYQNIINGVSMYATWDSPRFGTNSTWYLAHPAFAFFIGPFFAFFSPETSYRLFVLLSSCILALSGLVFANLTNSLTKKYLYTLPFVLSFPCYWVLFVGNIHAFTVLALSLIFVGFLKLIISGDSHSKSLSSLLKTENLGVNYIFFGTLLALFSKPVVILFIPILIIIKETRISTIIALFIYTVVSIIFVNSEILNPEISNYWQTFFKVLKNPDIVNIFEQKFRLTPEMRCNSIHWLNIIAASNFKFIHIDVFSFTNLVNKVFNKDLPSFISKFSIVICYVFVLLITKIKDEKLKLKLLFLNILTLSLCFFLAYQIVWEYQYASVVPLLISLFIYKAVLHNKTEGFSDLCLLLSLVFSFLVLLPSAFFVVERIYTINSYPKIAFIAIEASRVVPIMIIYTSLICIIYREIWKTKN